MRAANVFIAEDYPDKDLSVWECPVQDLGGCNLCEALPSPLLLVTRDHERVNDGTDLCLSIVT